MRKWLWSLLANVRGAVTHPTLVRDAVCDLVVDSLDADSPTPGYLEFRTSGDVEVATCVLSDPAFDAAGSAGGNSDGVATADPITDDSSATGGTIAKAALVTGGAVDKVLCSVTASTGGGDIEMNSVVISAGQTVSVSSLTYEAMP